MPHGLKNGCSTVLEVRTAGAHTQSGLAADSADLMRMMMAELAELFSADSILVKAHLYPRE
jgi:hypothetical protein